MSQFNYLNDINSFLTMEGEITRGPAPRWQKKMETSTASLNASTSRSKLSTSYNNSCSSFIGASSKTPSKGLSDARRGKKTPGKTPGRQRSLRVVFRWMANMFGFREEVTDTEQGSQDTRRRSVHSKSICIEFRRSALFGE